MMKDCPTPGCRERVLPGARLCPLCCFGIVVLVCIGLGVLCYQLLMFGK